MVSTFLLTCLLVGCAADVPHDGSDVVCAEKDGLGCQSSGSEYADDDTAMSLLQTQMTVAPHQNEAVLVEIDTVVKDDLLDVDKMALDLQSDAAKNVVVLQQKVDGMKADMDAAKAKFKVDRKVIRDNFKVCRKKIPLNKNKWKGTSQCAPFVPHFSGLLEGQEGEEVMIEGAQEERTKLISKRMNEEEEAFLEGRRPSKSDKKAKKDAKKAARKEKKADKKAATKEKKADKKAARKEKKADKKEAKEAARAAKCGKKPKCELRQAKRQAKLAAKENYKTIRKSFRDYRKQLRTAKFQKNILPKVIVLLKPQLLKALSQVDMNDDSSGQLRTCPMALTEEARTDCVPIAEIDSVSLLRNYMNVQLNGQLKDHFGTVFKKIKEGVWKVFDPPVDSIKSSLVAAVGTTPAVGGALAAAVGVIFDLLYKAIKYGVEAALDKVSKLLQSEVVKGIVNAVFATGLFTPAALQDTTQKATLASEMKKAGDAAEKAVQSSTQEQITDGAADAQGAAQADAQGAESEITAEGEDVEEGEAEDEQQDVDQDEEQDAEDIVDDDDE